MIPTVAETMQVWKARGGIPVQYVPGEKTPVLVGEKEVKPLTVFLDELLRKSQIVLGGWKSNSERDPDTEVETSAQLRTFDSPATGPIAADLMVIDEGVSHRAKLDTRYLEANKFNVADVIYSLAGIGLLYYRGPSKKGFGLKRM